MMMPNCATTARGRYCAARLGLRLAVALRIQKDARSQQATVLAFRRQDISAETTADIAELCRLLRLDPEAGEVKLVFGATAVNGQEIAVLTRSVFHLMQTMAAQVDVPAAHVAEHRASPGWESVSGAQSDMRMMTIRCSPACPPDASAAVRYRDHWFWIDDRDLESKRAFAFMMMMFTLAETGEEEPLPLITIPAH